MEMGGEWRSPSLTSLACSFPQKREFNGIFGSLNGAYSLTALGFVRLYATLPCILKRE